MTTTNARPIKPARTPLQTFGAALRAAIVTVTVIATVSLLGLAALVAYVVIELLNWTETLGFA